MYEQKLCTLRNMGPSTPSLFSPFFATTRRPRSGRYPCPADIDGGGCSGWVMTMWKTEKR
ncbi:hypothetical protein M404DRAFT_1001704 [Pisolithus tinctorius Marx 270]|uniref:Uncharacterized protein n=1 Tax=Pisolithus tinctorius Marx 270 TaxID=870435 RepID=A0A0C3P697_PISTI|nr:hypothetical protein M404DRAFT_1001704 [Pisolithus tinctorius Marx 270]